MTALLRCAGIGLLGLVACTRLAGARDGGDDPDLERLVAWMSGSFSSAAQAAADTTYYDVRLTMTPIWTGHTDGFWLYVEQALAARRETPYRQRVYRLRRINDSTFESAVFTLPDPMRYAGHGKSSAPLASLSPDSLTPRDGCSILLRITPDGAFAGGTQGRSCASELRGAAYATSRVTITDSTLESWDRGFDSGGRQVWGAARGGYRFTKSGDRP